MSWFKALLGGKPKSAAKKALPKKALAKKAGSADRAAIMAEALRIHTQARAHTQAVLEETFNALRANPPKPSDLAGMTRLLSLREALLRVKGKLDEPSGPQMPRPKSTKR